MKAINHFTIKHFVLSLFVLTTLFAGSLVTVARAETTPPTSIDSLQKMIDDLLLQIKALQAQLNSLPQTGNGSTCFQFTRTMYLGSSDATANGEVTKLQEYLISTGDYTYGKPTGYFGPSTQKAVQSWQAKNGVVSSGTPASTGYGLVGKSTRALMNKSCGDVVPPDSSKVELGIASPAINGEVYSISDPIRIAWHSVGISSVSIALYKDDKWAYWIEKDKKIAQDGSTGFKWEIPKEALGVIGDGNNLKIYITGRKSDNSGYQDVKSALFSISSRVSSAPVEIVADVDVNAYYDEAFLNLAIKGFKTNSKINYWTLDIQCEDGISLYGKYDNKVEICNESNKIYAKDQSDVTKDLVILVSNAKITGKDNTQYTAKFILNGYSKEGAKLGSDNYSLTLGGASNASGIKVTSPNGGEKWKMGSVNTITWAPYQYGPDINPASEVTAYLDQMVGGKFVEVGKIMENGKASIHTHFEVGKYGNFPKPGNYYVRVVNNRTGATDRSDKPFRLESNISVPEGIRVTSPNGGEKWTIGGTNTITWTPYQYNPNINPSTDVTAYLDKMVDGKFVQVGRIMESGKASIHTYLDIDKFGNYPEAGSYYVRVVNNKTGDTDRSDKPFTITVPPPTVGLQAQYIVEDGYMNKKDYASLILVTANFPKGTDYCTFVGSYSNGGKVTIDEKGFTGEWVGVSFKRVGPYPNLVLRSVAVDCNYKGKQLTSNMPIEPAGFSPTVAPFDILVNGVSYEGGKSNQAEAYARCQTYIEASEKEGKGELECKWNGVTFFKKSSWKG